MKYIIVAIISVIVFFLQTWFMPIISVFGYTPSIIFAFLVTFLCLRDLVRGGVLAVIFGAAMDMFFGVPFGFYLFPYSVSILAIGLIKDYFQEERIYVPPLLCTIGYFFEELITAGILTLKGGTFLEMLATCFTHSLPTAIYTGILVFAIYPPMKKLYGFRMMRGIEDLRNKVF